MDSHEENPASPREGNRVTDDISFRNQQASPLLRVPAELRDKIYEYVLAGLQINIPLGYHIHDSAILQWKLQGTMRWDLRLPKHMFALTESCRQIRAEAETIPFTHNEFSGITKALKRLVTGAIFDSSRVLLLQQIRIYVGETDIRHRQPGLELAADLNDLLLVLCGLPGLRRITLDWFDGGLPQVVDEFLLGKAKSILMQHPRASGIEITLVSDGPGDLGTEGLGVSRKRRGTWMCRLGPGVGKWPTI